MESLVLGEFARSSQPEVLVLPGSPCRAENGHRFLPTVCAELTKFKVLMAAPPQRAKITAYIELSGARSLDLGPRFGGRWQRAR